MPSSASSLSLVKKERRAKTSSVSEVYKILTKNTLTKNAFDDLPLELLKKILGKYEGLLTYELIDGIPQDKLNYDVLSENHNAIDFLILRRNQHKINYHRLSGNTNPKVVELLKERILKERVMPRDEYIINLKNKKNIDWFSVSKNTILIEILNDTDNIEKLKWSQLSANPEALDILLANEDKIDFDELSTNLSTRAIKYLSLPDNRDNISWADLSRNPSRDALKLLSLPENYKNIVWGELSGNTNRNAIQLLKRKWEEEKILMEDDIEEYIRLKENDGVIVWSKVCGNHSAIDLLRIKIAEEKNISMDEYFQFMDSEEINWRIDWSILSGNKGVIRLLRKKIAEEKKLSEDEYDRLEEYEKIDWSVLCGNISPEAIDLLRTRLQTNPRDIDWEVLSGSLNPRAIELLDANQDKIFWGAFSSNTTPRAIELLKKRILLEKRLEKEGTLSDSKKKNISWIGLSRNPSIFRIATIATIA
jgi:hypothetical protein